MCASGRTFALNLGLADGEHKVGGHGLGRHVKLAAVQELVFQKYHRVGVRNGGLDEALGVLCAVRRDDLRGRGETGDETQ